MEGEREIVVLQERTLQIVPPGGGADRIGTLLWERYPTQVEVEFPSPRTGGCWRFTPRDWVGHLPLSRDLTVIIQPKTSVANLFRMLEYAYGLASFRFLDGESTTESVADLYERLAHVLARRVLDRLRGGVHRAYVPRREVLPVVRERLEVERMMRTPWVVQPHCRYHLHTADVEDNQILAWTLHVVMRSRLQRAEVRAAVREAYRGLQGAVTVRPFRGRDCVGRRYSRLNDDYHMLHTLCRFFLEHTGPTGEPGDRMMLPFLVHMARLYEQFVAAWLQAHVPPPLRFEAQERVPVQGATHFNLDLVLYDADGTARYVLDTKYKTGPRPSTADVAQVVAYAVARGCREALLVYPEPLAELLDTHVGEIHIRTLTFNLDTDLEAVGAALLEQLPSR